MTEPEVALALSPERWVEELHRHCADHGGARVRQVIVDPATVLDEHYDVLVASHRWPGLTRSLVSGLHERGRAVLGIFDPAEPASRAHLERLEVDGMVAADAAPLAMVGVVIELASSRTPPVPPPWPALLVNGERGNGPRNPAAGHRGWVVAVGGPPGAGRTEVAVTLAAAFGARGHSTVLVDVDDVAPAVAPRLGLPLEPHLLSATDAAEHSPDDVGRARLSVRGARFGAIAGLPSPRTWRQVRAPAVAALLDALVVSADVVVLDTGPAIDEERVDGRDRHGLTRVALGRADVVVALGHGSPVGLTRLLDWTATYTALAHGPSPVLAVNRVPSDAYRRRELFDELQDAFGAPVLALVPADRRVDAAAWDGLVPDSGPFRSAVADLAARLLPGAIGTPSTPPAAPRARGGLARSVVGGLLGGAPR